MTANPAAYENPLLPKAKHSPKHAARRTEILDAAASIFAEIGYMRASTGDIAARLGMRQSNLYYYIRSKDEALAEICLLALRDYVHNISEILASSASFPIKLRAAIRAHLDILIERPDHFVTFLTCRHELPDDARREVGVISRNYEELLARLIAEGVHAGEIAKRADPHFTASCLMATCHNPAFYRKAFLGRSIDQLTDEITDLFLNGLARP